MINEMNKPYSWELEFYQKNNIPLWETLGQTEKFLGKIYESDNGSFVDATVTCMPAQFWKFKIYSSEREETIEVSTGSGGLITYFEMMKMIADGMIVIKEPIHKSK